MATAVAVVAVVALAAATTKTLAAIVMAGVTDKNKPKAAEEEILAETAMTMVTMTTTARAMTATARMRISRTTMTARMTGKDGEDDRRGQQRRQG